jgi:hypothetical protein
MELNGTSAGSGYDHLQITYKGGTGNHVVLTRIGSTVRFDAITRLAASSIQLHATGALSGTNYTLQGALNLNPTIQWSNLASAIADSAGMLSFHRKCCFISFAILPG